ncbi:alpha/beta hydrolase family protein [Blastopirellula retiformator]|nr:hypothetical protein [Blastopirellula retiformator]
MSSLCTARHAAEHLYPWSVDDLFPTPDHRLPLIGYGSLMNLASARRSLSAECLASAKPVIVLGARRIYEYVMSPRGRGVYGEAVAHDQFGVLNAQATGDRADWFNAMMFQMSVDDIPALLSRESAYDLVPAWTLCWNGEAPQPSIGYFFSCRRDSYDGRQLLDSQILPHPGYHAICEEGCEAISPEFLHAFRTTTWARQARLIDAVDPQAEST